MLTVTRPSLKFKTLKFHRQIHGYKFTLTNFLLSCNKCMHTKFFYKLMFLIFKECLITLPLERKCQCRKSSCFLLLGELRGDVGTLLFCVQWGQLCGFFIIAELQCMSVIHTVSSKIFRRAHNLFWWNESLAKCRANFNCNSRISVDWCVTLFYLPPTAMPTTSCPVVSDVLWLWAAVCVLMFSCVGSPHVWRVLRGNLQLHRIPWTPLNLQTNECICSIHNDVIFIFLYFKQRGCVLCWTTG